MTVCWHDEWRWLDCEECPPGECPVKVCVDCGADVAEIPE